MSLPRITVVGLGPGGPDLLTAGTLELIAQHEHRYLRTSRHPAASVLGDAPSFDEIYEQAPSFEAVYGEIVERLVASAIVHGAVLYAVPGSPAVAERTVEALRIDRRVEVEVVAALSFVDLTWVRLGVDPLTERPRIVDGHRFAMNVAGDHGPFLVTQCHSAEILSDIKLAFDDQHPPTVTVLSRLGLADESIIEIAWNDLDRVAADHLTSLWIPRLATPLGSAFASIEAVMRALRTGCPWDREQTHDSLAPYVVEEAGELVGAIAALSTALAAADATDPADAVNAADTSARNCGGNFAGNVDAAIDHLADELGDVLFQAVFHACLAAEQGWFTLADVVAGLEAKLVRRHPHVFAPVGSTDGEWSADTPEQVKHNWQRIKAMEKAEPRPFLPSIS